MDEQLSNNHHQTESKSKQIQRAKEYTHTHTQEACYYREQQSNKHYFPSYSLFICQFQINKWLSKHTPHSWMCQDKSCQFTTTALNDNVRCAPTIEGRS